MSQSHKDNIQKMCENDCIEWNFAPPYSPHFGELYEAAVKSAKFHLRRIVGNASLTFEELNTVIKQVEAVLNSRPLTPMSSNPNDLQVLTPGHFLIGRALASIPEPYAIEPRIDLCLRWKLVDPLVLHFWKRWLSEYLVELQQRKYWTDGPKLISVGDIVLIKDDNIPPLKWNSGRITKLKPDTDGVVRVVELQTQFNIIDRAVARICPLYSESTYLLNDGSFKVGEHVETNKESSSFYHTSQSLQTLFKPCSQTKIKYHATQQISGNQDNIHAVQSESCNRTHTSNLHQQTTQLQRTNNYIHHAINF